MINLKKILTPILLMTILFGYNASSAQTGTGLTIAVCAYLGGKIISALYNAKNTDAKECLCTHPVLETLPADLANKCTASEPKASFFFDGLTTNAQSETYSQEFWGVVEETEEKIENTGHFLGAVMSSNNCTRFSQDVGTTIMNSVAISEMCFSGAGN